LKELQNYLKIINSLISKIETKNIDILYTVMQESFQNNSRIFIVGNGGSSSIASHAAGDLMKLRVEDNSLNIITLNDNVPLLTAFTNDFGYENALVEIVKNYQINEADIVITISSSGNSKNLINLINYSNKQGATTFALTGFKQAELTEISKYSINLESSKGYYGPVEDIHMMIFHIFSHFIKSDIPELS
jgi:D-sedoheptulose 7-phosphate isomerase|tara:strand:+ start:7660 stop:8229 length:570 start_codon:yes stop_codon:yes gene_type:complete